MPDDLLDRPLAAFDPLLDNAPFEGFAEIEGKPVLQGLGSEEYRLADDLFRDEVFRPADVALDPFPGALARRDRRPGGSKVDADKQDIVLLLLIFWFHG